MNAAKTTVQLYGYLRPYANLKPHQIPAASDKDLADALTSNDE